MATVIHPMLDDVSEAEMRDTSEADEIWTSADPLVGGGEHR